MGQARIEESEFSLPGDVSDDVARFAVAYAQAAGLSIAVDSMASFDRTRTLALFPHGEHFRHPSALAVAQGTHLALRSILDALDLTSPSDPLAAIFSRAPR